MPLEICGVLVQLFAVLAAHAVDHQMVMKMVCVQVCCHDYLKIWELLLRELHADGVDLLWRQPVLRREGLDEVIELSAIRFSKLLFGCHHSRYDALATQLCPVTIHWSSSMVLQACVTYFSTPIIVPTVCFLLRTAVKMAITAPPG